MLPLHEALAKEFLRHGPDPCFRFVLAEGGDIERISVLNAQVVASLPGGGMFMRQDAAFFRTIMESGGAIAMAMQAGALTAYSVAAPVSAAFPVFTPGTGSTGLLFGTAVAEAVRGQGLQTLMIDFRYAALRACGCDTVQATVAPTNYGSLENLIHAGFEIIALRTLLDGHPRFIVQRPTIPEIAHGHSGLVFQPLDDDLTDHEALLAAGARGVGMVRRPRPGLWYCMAQEATP